MVWEPGQCAENHRSLAGGLPYGVAAQLAQVSQRWKSSLQMWPRDLRVPPRRSSLSPPRGQIRMCRNPGVLTYDWTKNGGRVATVDREWQETFRNCMRGFEARRAPGPGEAAVSIKVRVVSGCFHREHSPRAYELIDRSLTKLPGSDGSFAFEEHESGTEILVYLALTTAGLSDLLP